MCHFVLYAFLKKKNRFEWKEGGATHHIGLSNVATLCTVIQILLKGIELCEHTSIQMWANRDQGLKLSGPLKSFGVTISAIATNFFIKK